MSRPKVAYSLSHEPRDIAIALKRERPDLDPDDYIYLLYAQRVGRILEAVYDKHCRNEFEMSAADMRVLLALRRAGPSYALRPTELFRSLLVTSGAITKQVDRLMAVGYVDRRPGPKKSGGFLIHLTKKGFKAADETLTSIADSSVVSINALTSQERKTINGLFEKILNDLERRLPEEGGTDSREIARPSRRKTSRAKR